MVSFSRTFASFRAGTLSDKKTYSTYLAFDQSFGSSVRVITQAEVIAEYILFGVTGLLVKYFIPARHATRWKTAIGALEIGAQFIKKAPLKAAGQTYVVTVSYANNRMYQNLKIYHNYQAYIQSPNNPMYNNTSSVAIPGF